MGEAQRAEGYDAWRELRARTHVQLEFAELEDCDGRTESDADGRRIVLDYRLGRVDRNAVLVHELTHEERDVLYTEDTPAALVEKEEYWVRQISTDRLVDPLKLRRFLSLWDSEAIGVSARMVAEEFDVPVSIAEHAMKRLDMFF